MNTVWSYGGGTQSVAIAVLVAQGKLPKPDCVVIADTGREKSVTWTYTDAHVRPLLAPLGIEIQVARHDLATVDLYGHNGDLLIPAYTRGESGDGKLPTFCSTEWKKSVVRRFLRQQGYGPKNPVEMWIGISVDEVGRAKPADVQWITHKWPLLFDHPMRRHECTKLVEDYGLPTPPKSACWMCPHHRAADWVALREQHPDDFAKAVQLDIGLRLSNPTVFLHRDRAPLDVAVANTPDDETDQVDLFGNFPACDSGMCWV